MRAVTGGASPTRRVTVSPVPVWSWSRMVCPTRMPCPGRVVRVPPGTRKPCMVVCCGRAISAVAYERSPADRVTGSWVISSTAATPGTRRIASRSAVVAGAVKSTWASCFCTVSNWVRMAASIVSIIVQELRISSSASTVPSAVNAVRRRLRPMPRSTYRQRAGRDAEGHPDGGGVQPQGGDDGRDAGQADGVQVQPAQGACGQRAGGGAEQAAGGAGDQPVAEVVAQHLAAGEPGGEHGADDWLFGLDPPGEQDVGGQPGRGQKQQREQVGQFAEAVDVLVQQRVGRLLVAGDHVGGAG